MSYNDSFDRETLRLMGAAQRGARTQNKPAITSYMVAKSFILNASEMAGRVFGEQQLDKDAFLRMANIRIGEMPTVADAQPYVDDEVDRIVRESARYDENGQMVPGSVTAEAMLRIILRLHLDEFREFVQGEHANPQPAADQPEHERDRDRLAEVLRRYGKDWTQCAVDGELEPVVGRDKELAEVVRVLCQKNKNSAVLTGDAGTGKTAIGEALTLKIVRGDVPAKLRGAKVLSIYFNALMEREGYHGVRIAIDAVCQAGNAILIIDEIHTLNRQVTEELKAPMARGKIKILGMTTDEEFSQFVESNQAFARRIRRVFVKEPSEEDTLEILKKLRPGLEEFHGVRIADDALTAAIGLSQRYISNRRQPDKSIDLVDEAASKAAVAKQRRALSEDDIRAILAEKTGIPVERLSTDEAARLMNMEQELSARVIGQPEAISVVAKAVRRGSAGLSNPGRPVASLLFNGHSGMGKTMLAQVLAEFLFGAEDSFKRLDMSEYQEAHTVSRLIGSPPGYVGYNEGGQLTEFVSKRPYSLILFDEIEKAHPDVFRLLLQVLDYGSLTDGRGRKVDFTNTIVIFTSNLVDDGTFSARQRIGFGTGVAGGSQAPTGEAIRRHFSPEFLNRLDKIVQFNDLGRPALLEIARHLLDDLKEKTLAKGFKVEFDDSVAEFIIGLDPGFGQGARPIRNAIEQHVEDLLAEKILSGGQSRGRKIRVTASDGAVRIA